MRVRVPPRPLRIKTFKQKTALAYIVGIALGDGNLSNPNGRAERLRITCDTRYPKIQREIIANLKILLPKNSIITVRRPRNCVDISVYSNMLAGQLPWKTGLGSKYLQNAHVPVWVWENNTFLEACVRGLLQTDGSIYFDRGYKMINFTNNTFALSKDVFAIIKHLGFSPTFHESFNSSGNKKFTVRIAREVDVLIKQINLIKA